MSICAFGRLEPLVGCQFTQVALATEKPKSLTFAHSQVDVRNYEIVQDMVDKTIKKYRRIDVLVCTCWVLIALLYRPQADLALCLQRQQRRDMVGERREDADEAVSIDATSESGRLVRLHPGLSSLLLQKR